MFDVNTVNRRYFEININGEVLNVLPPKIKLLKKLTSTMKNSNEDILDNLVDSVKSMLSRNKENINIDDAVEDMDMDQLMAVMTAYFEWINNVKSSKN